MSIDLPTPTLDVVIAVHDPRRDVGRAVASAISDPTPGIRVVVVCHGIRADSIAAQLPNAGPSLLRVIEFADGIRSPAGPFNAGLDAAAADYVMVMGSDDFLEAGAVAAWRERARVDRPDVLIVEQRTQAGHLIPTPLVRPRRSRKLSTVRDRLFSRTAPLALMRRGLLDELGLRFSVGLATGEDIAFSSRLWAEARRIDLARHAPRYVIGSDAIERVSGGPVPILELLKPVLRTLDLEWVGKLDRPVARSLGIKLLRVHLLTTVLMHPDAADWNDEARASLSEVLHGIDSLVPNSSVALPRADQRLLHSLRDVTGSDAIARAIGSRQAASRWDSIMPSNLLRAFDRESTPTRYFTYALDRSRLRVSSAAGARAR